MASSFFAMSVYVCDGGCAASTPPDSNVASIPDVGSGNYHNFDVDDCTSVGEPEIYANLSMEEAMLFYEEISAGDFSRAIPVPLPSIFDFLEDVKWWGDYAPFYWDMAQGAFEGINKQNPNLTYDPEGRLLHINEGYSVVTISRVYCNNWYSATETEYFIFNESYELIFNDVISTSYYIN